MTSPQPGAAAASARPAGWYLDPWRVAPWRWWDGETWTTHVGGGPPAQVLTAVAPPRPTSTGSVSAAAHRPRLPRWLSPPVLVGSVVSIPLAVATIAMAPVVLLLALVPLCFALPTLAWLDRVEPEPRASRVHALLWGAMIAALVAGIVNSIVAALATESIAAVVSAPLIEEAMKGAGVVWAVRRREVDGVMDGIVYACWVGLGFAFVENFEYFLMARHDGSLAGTFVLRALLTPFAHPLFTAWTGLAIGRAVGRRRPLLPSALLGWAMAALTHAAWNGSLTFAEGAGGGNLLLLVAAAFMALFVGAVVTVLRVRAHERRRFLAMVPDLARRYGFTAAQLAVFCDWRQLLATRRALPRARRHRFDAVHGALARLAALHERAGGHGDIDPIDEEPLVGQLRHAWERAQSA